jgi:hypothetical protein
MSPHCPHHQLQRLVLLTSRVAARKACMHLTLHSVHRAWTCWQDHVARRRWKKQQMVQASEMYLEMMQAESVSQCLHIGLRLHSIGVQDAVQRNAAALAAQLQIVRPFALKWLAQMRRASQWRVRQQSLLRRPHEVAQGNGLQHHQQGTVSAQQGIPHCGCSLSGTYARPPARTSALPTFESKAVKDGIGAPHNCRVQHGWANFVYGARPLNIPSRYVKSHIIKPHANLPGAASMHAQGPHSLENPQALGRHIQKNCPAAWPTEYNRDRQAAENRPPCNSDSQAFSMQQVVQGLPYQLKARTQVCTCLKTRHCMSRWPAWHNCNRCLTTPSICNAQPCQKVDGHSACVCRLGGLHFWNLSALATTLEWKLEQVQCANGLTGLSKVPLLALFPSGENQCKQLLARTCIFDII